jgi:trk system potassium uptake protein TrkH
MGMMANETLFMLCILMFIGACPGSCGGGVKTTTVAGLAVMGISRLRGFSRPQVFRRTLTDASISKAASVVMISAAVIILAVLVLMISELGGISHTQTRGRFLELFFETISAFGTVGLSTGITDTLSSFGRLTITDTHVHRPTGPDGDRPGREPRAHQPVSICRRKYHDRMKK